MNPLRFLLRCSVFAFFFGLLSSAVAADIGLYGVAKKKNYIQSTDASPTFTNAFFQCFVDSTGPDLITSASVQIPGGGSRTLAADGPDGFSFEEAFSSDSAMNATYGTGTYTLMIDSENDGFSYAQLTMPSDSYSPAPFITNYFNAQNIDAGSSFTLYWSSFVGGTANDLIEVTIQDSNGNDVFSSPGPGSPGALNGTSTFITIPANTLASGQTYQAKVNFIKIVVSDSTSIPGAQGVVGFLCQTYFNLQTSNSGGTGQIGFYGLVKMQSLEQNSDAAPVPSTNNPPFQFQSFVNASSSNVVTFASVQIPSGATNLLIAEDSGKGWFFEEGFSSQSALNAAYGTGAYTMTISEQGTNTHNISLPMPAASADAYPDTPQLTNYTAAQTINPSNDFTLYWNTFTGGTTNDFVQARITAGSDNTIYRSGQPNEPDALDGTSPSFLQIPANTLEPGTTYNFELLFAHPVSTDTTNIAGALGFAAYAKRTVMQIHTTGTAPVLQLEFTGMVNGHFQFQFNSQPGQSYQIQWADLLPNWGDLWFTNATATVTVFTDSFPVNTQRFYRVQKVP